MKLYNFSFLRARCPWLTYGLGNRSLVAGAIKKLAQNFFGDADGKYSFQAWSEAIPVRAVSKTDAPKFGKLEPCGGDAFRMSFLYAWQLAIANGQDNKSLKGFMEGCRSMRVKFQYFATWEEFELSKWKVADRTQEIAESQVLVGLKRARAVAELQVSLKNGGHAAEPEDLAKFFSQANLRSMSGRVISMMVKIWTRFAQAGPAVCNLVETLDSEYGVHHTFNSHSNLDFLCQRTSCKTNPALQNSLLQWVLECFCYEVTKGKVAADVTGPGLKALLHRYLLKRRIVGYISKKFQGVDGDSEASHSDLPPEYSPSRVLQTVLGTMEGFRTSGLNSELPANLAWFGRLDEYLQRLLLFGSLVLRGATELDAVMDGCLGRDSLMSAEAFLLDASFKKLGLYDQDEFVSAAREARQPKRVEEDPPPPDPPAPTPEPETAVIEDKAAPGPDDEDKPEELDAMEPVIEDSEFIATIMRCAAAVFRIPQALKEKPDVLDRLSFFPLLRETMSELFIDILKKNSCDVAFVQLVEEAKLRRNTYVQFKVAPTPGAWRLESFPEGPKLFRIDLKTSRTPTDGSGLKNPWRYVPVVRKDENRNIIHRLFGDPKVKDDKQVFGLEATDILLFHDGRNPRAGEVFVKELVKPMGLRSSLWPARRVMALRLLYHNGEWEDGGYASPTFRRKASPVGSCVICPEPLETVWCVKPKDLVIPEKPRLYCDLPGSNRDRGWAKNSMKSDDDHLLTRVSKKTLEAMFAGEGGCDTLHDEELALEDGEDEPVEGSEPEPLAYGFVYPWEAEEKQYLEWFNCFCASDQVKVIDLYAGPIAAIAACRSKRTYLGYVPTILCKDVLYEMVLLRIVLDMVLNVQGFQPRRRHLTRAQSLGGDADADLDAALPRPGGDSAAAVPSQEEAAPPSEPEEEHEESD
ncbi:unnamed protein product [Durusdinium trenchii]|uniref:Uncharacterized protein n=1 Tax=Durusdinium trenchii TaxID=1381693 RepID=A0ABP0IAH8_9DINO